MNATHYRRALKDYVKQRGWRIEQTRKHHYKLTHPSFQNIVYAPGSPSDWRAFEAVKTKMRRAERGIGDRHRSHSNRRH